MLSYLADTTLAGLDLHRGTVTEIVSETHKSKDFIELLKKLDSAYPAATTLRLILGACPSIQL